MNEKKFDRQIRIWGKKGQEIIELTNILVVGAGGIGAEVLKNLVFLGFQRITVVDLDKIEITNLNRQIFFDESDQGKFKAEVTVNKMKGINPKGQYYYLNKKIQDIEKENLVSFDYIISTLDNLSARIWLNEKCVELNKKFIDGGAEGFIGHVQVVIPGTTPCLMCQNLWIQQTEKFKCNYAINPRTPNDCALEARDQFFLKYKRFPELEDFKDQEILFELAEFHARKFGIIGVSTPLIIDTLKNVVAQIITTNAIIGSVISNELLKLILEPLDKNKWNFVVNNFIQYNGITGKMWTVPLEKNNNCIVCSKKIFKINVDPTIPLESFAFNLEDKININLNSPIIIQDDKIIFRFKETKNEEEKKRLEDLKSIDIKKIFKNGDILYVEDEITSLNFKIEIKFT